MILLAVVLFAALSYAVTSSMRGDGKSGDSENRKAQASQIINYATLVEQTVKRMMLSGGCAVTQLSFRYGSNGYSDAHSPSDKHCNVFDPSGGGLAWELPSAQWLVAQSTANSYSSGGTDYGIYNFPAETCISGIGGTWGCGGSNSDNKELVIGLKYLSPELCDAINKELGYATNSTSEACYPASNTFRFNGIFPTWGQHTCIAANNKATYCVNSTGTGYTFYHVLVAR